jgi:cytochrome c peroxidase
MPHLSSTIDFIKNQVFPKGKILSQEMVISDDKKVLALCDLSSENAVMEIKTFNVVKEKTEQGYFAAAELTDQLYYEKRVSSSTRKCCEKVTMNACNFRC